MQKDMIPILQSEGFEVNERGLMRLRTKHGMKLRAGTGWEAPEGEEVDPEQHASKVPIQDPEAQRPDEDPDAFQQQVIVQPQQPNGK